MPILKNFARLGIETLQVDMELVNIVRIGSILPHTISTP